MAAAGGKRKEKEVDSSDQYVRNWRGDLMIKTCTEKKEMKKTFTNVDEFGRTVVVKKVSRSKCPPPPHPVNYDPPPPDPIRPDLDEGRHIGRFKRRRTRSRSRSRSEERSRNRWTHDRFHSRDSRSPSPVRERDPSYKPPEPSWVSRAGGVYIPRRS